MTCVLSQWAWFGKLGKLLIMKGSLIKILHYNLKFLVKKVSNKVGNKNIIDSVFGFLNEISDLMLMVSFWNESLMMCGCCIKFA